MNINALRLLAGGAQESPLPVAPEVGLAALELAPTVTADGGSGSAFGSELGALRLLRHLTLGQARGQVTASPTSLRDLALVGAAVTTPDLSWLPEPGTSLGRLQRARAHDVLEAAHAAWTSAAEDLTWSVVGITRAPRLYAEAVGHVRDAEQLRPAVRAAVLSALPRLGADAARTIEHLHSQNALLGKQRDGVRLAMVWRPISHADAADLAERFTQAAASSEPAATWVRRLLVRPERTAPEPEELVAPSPRREVQLSRMAQR